MKYRLTRVCLLLALVIFTRPLLADTNTFNLIRLKQGCSIACPNDLIILGTNNIEKVTELVDGKIAELLPKLTFKPNQQTVLLMAVDTTNNTSAQMQLAVGPAEATQDNLKGMTPEKATELADAMYKQLQPVFEKLKVTVTKRLPAKVMDGRHLKYFLFAYEFSDPAKPSQVSLRAYYYTKSGTFIVSFASNAAYIRKNTAMVQEILGSLNVGGE